MCVHSTLTSPINVVCQYYKEHYNSKQPIPAIHLGELGRTFLANTRHRYGYHNGSSFRSHIYGSHRKTATSSFADNKTFYVQTHYKPTETFQYMHFSSSHPLSVKKGFIKGETLCLLRTRSKKFSSYMYENWNFQLVYSARLPERTRQKYSSRSKILITKQDSTKQKTSRNVLPFIMYLRRG